MDWNRVRGNWWRLGGELKRVWAKLTHDDVLALEGGREVFLGKVQQRPRVARAEVERKLDDLLARLERNRKVQPTAC